MRALSPSGVPGVASLVAALLLASACVTPIGEPAPEAPSAWAGLGRDFFVRQAVVARIETPDGEEKRGFEIALQSRCGELRVVGLAGFGVRLFTAVRDADGLQVETLGGRELPAAGNGKRTYSRSTGRGVTAVANATLGGCARSRRTR